jgi:hypothetical protein
LPGEKYLGRKINAAKFLAGNYWIPSAEKFSRSPERTL